MSEAKESYIRFSLAQRVEHIVLILSFTTLGLTGLPQKFPLSPISQGLINVLGGIETVRIIHRVAATVFLLEAIYHLVVLGYKLFVRRERASMVPTVKDAKDAVDSFKFNLGLQQNPPKMPRYNFVEKAEYWAMLWGLFVMAVTGFMLWNPIATTNILPGEFIPAAKVAHGGEAVLAVLAIILWHFWHVHIRHFNKSMFTGRIDRHAMAEEHGEELELIETGRVSPPPPPEEQKARMKIFVPVASVVSLVLLAGVYWFVSFEQSSVTTVPPIETVEVFSPQTPTPAPTAAPTQPVVIEQEEPGAMAGPAWSGDLETVFEEKCTACHGAVGGFSAESYEEVLEAIEPGNPDNSAVVSVQQGGGHPGQFSDEELERVVAWIEAGAPEEAGAAGGSPGDGGAEGSSPTFSSQVGALFEEKCTACHGAVGGFSAESYEEVMEAVTPNDAEGSLVVEVQKDGGHPGQFTDEELQVIIDWINAGAPE